MKRWLAIRKENDYHIISEFDELAQAKEFINVAARPGDYCIAEVRYETRPLGFEFVERKKIIVPKE